MISTKKIKSKKQYLKIAFFAISQLLIFQSLQAQRFPTEAENIEYLVTFGKDGDTSWGDDDFSQTFFFSIPLTQKAPFYIRVFDPDTSGKLDENSGVFDTEITYSVYGGNGTHTEPDARKLDPKGKYHSGTLLAKKTFGVSKQWDNTWYSFGPFNPVEGEYSAEFESYIFKIIADGTKGNDGNLYYYYVSAYPDENTALDGCNAFTYEYSFRLGGTKSTLAHIYPFITENIASVKQSNFDFDKGGEILLYSVTKNRQPATTSGDNVWASSIHKVDPEEVNTSLDIQIVKRGGGNNDIVLFITNQYNEPIPFFSIPIGGAPRYKYKPKISYKRKKGN